MITIIPCGSRRSKGVPSGSGVFLRLLVWGAVAPQTCPHFRIWQMLYPYKMLLHVRRVRSGPEVCENAQF